MKDGQELHNLLRQHSGCDQPYSHAMVKKFFYTPGVRDFALHAGQGAYWLLDILATEPKITNLINNEGFGLVLLTVNGTKAKLTVAGDSGIPPVFSHDLDYTDCPEAPGGEKAWMFYLEPTQVGDTEGIMCMLPQER